MAKETELMSTQELRLRIQQSIPLAVSLNQSRTQTKKQFKIDSMLNVVSMVSMLCVSLWMLSYINADPQLSKHVVPVGIVLATLFMFKITDKEKEQFKEERRKV